MNVDIVEKNIKDTFYWAQKYVHNISQTAGWYHDIKTGESLDRNVPEMICLMHSELSEAMEGLRKDLQDDHLPDRKAVEVEFADCIIRILDAAEYLNLDVGSALVEKCKYNQQREDHKIESRNKENGKKF